MVSTMTEGTGRNLQLSRLLLAGLGAGGTSAFVNNLYFLAYRKVTGIRVTEPTFTSITISSLFPSVLAALGYFALSRASARKAPAIFLVVTCAITIASFAGVLQETLPNGALKPPGFDGLVMPMHVAVGVAAALLIPRWGRP
jgi:hypothetical protein